MAIIQITPKVALDERELVFDFMRASGPGGQNVNKVETAVQLRFHVGNSPGLNDEIRARLMRLAGKRMTQEGELVIDARRYRTQAQNRQDAIDQLADLIRRASVRPKVRRPTKPTKASRERRLAGKKRRSDIKRLRRSHDE